MQNNEIQPESLFIVVVDEAPTILCEAHAKAFAEIMASLDKPFTIVEMTIEDAQDHECMACDMQDELSRPRIILPH
jgi:predicted hotdog family 3-hydroxylacyl-ACP dehydratase